LDKSFLKQTLLTPFLAKLRLFGELHGPTVSDNGVVAFAKIDADTPLQLDYRRTLIPPKKYLFPHRQNLLQYRDGNYRQNLQPAEKIVLFGVHGCDLDGIDYLDRVFMADRPDPSYAARREALTLVGISCEADDFCFCSGNFQDAPCDLFLSAGKDGFQLTVSSSKGEAIAHSAAELLSEAQPLAAPSVTRCPIQPQDPQLRFSDNPLWERFANSCVSCGACSVCCPTCYCFDIREYPNLEGGGARLREWDNCLFVTHGEVSGANFRASRLDRLRYRFLHKYCGFTPLQGMTSCVGCGRCKEVCPVDIDLRELFAPPDPAPEETL
jgi:sulfhydrogenase subunit beta (sulfur reductase)